jgi:hypothetical protein
VNDTDNIVALLKEKPTELVNDYSASNLTMTHRIIAHFPFTFSPISTGRAAWLQNA